MADKTFNKTQVINLIKQLTGQKNLLTTPSLFIRALGDMNAGVLLGQILYWQDRTTREDGYFWKSRRDWNDELGLSEDQVRRATRILKRASCGLETKVLKAKGSPTVHYRLNEDKFLAWVMEESSRVAQMDLGYSPNGIGSQDKTITQTTHILPTENNSIISSPHSSEKIASPADVALPKTEKGEPGKAVRIVQEVEEETLEPVGADSLS